MHTDLTHDTDRQPARRRFWLTPWTRRGRAAERSIWADIPPAPPVDEVAYEPPVAWESLTLEERVDVLLDRVDDLESRVDEFC